MFYCSAVCLLLTAATLPTCLQAEKNDVWKRVALNVNGRFVMDSFLSQVTTASGIECALTCSLDAMCHQFHYRKDASTCFLSPIFKKLNQSAMGELVFHVHFDGVTCPLREDYDYPAACLCWRLEMRGVGHDVARQECESEGATLLLIKTEERRRLVSTYINSLGKNVTQMWVGALALDATPTPSWSWGDGDIFYANFSLWRIQPVVSSGAEHCVRTHPDGTYYLNTVPCTQALPYICEIVLPQ